MSKCGTCLNRYVCNDEHEWECRNRDYLYYNEDTEKVKELKGSMKVLVTQMPEEPKDCLFSEFEPRGDFYVCTLRAYIPKADERNTGYKPKCLCKDCSKCCKLEVLK